MCICWWRNCANYQNARCNDQKKKKKTRTYYIPYYGNMLRPNVVIFRPSCDKNHVADYRITSQMLANKTEARQRTCAEWPSKCWKPTPKGGQLLICLFQYLYTSDLWGCLIRYTCTKRGITVCSLTSWESKYTQANSAILGYYAASIGTLLLTFRGNLCVSS